MLSHDNIYPIYTFTFMSVTSPFILGPSICDAVILVFLKNVCLFLFVEVNALLDLCYMLYNIRRKIKFLCICLCLMRYGNDRPWFIQPVIHSYKSRD